MPWNYGGSYGITLNNGPNISMDYWNDSLYQRLTALIDFKNLPVYDGERQQYTWDIDALKYGLYAIGYLVIFNSSKYGLVPVPGTLTGHGIQYQPTAALVNTPYFQYSEPLRIGLHCELLKITPDYSSVFPIVSKYAAELKEIDTSIKAAAKNSRLAYVLIGANDKTARALKNVREKIIDGDDAIIDESLLRRKATDGEALPWYEFTRDIKQSYILNDLLEARRMTLIDFYREIGVRMLDDKKERMISAEVDAGNAETFIRSEVWAETLKTSVEKINRHYGTNIEVIINRPDFSGGLGGDNNVS